MSFVHVRCALAMSLVCLVGCGSGAVPGEVPAGASETSGAEPESAAPAPEAEPEEPAAEPPAEPPAEPAAQVTKPAPAPPRFLALVTYVVKDYETWKEVFDGDTDARKGAGIVGHTVLLHPKAKAKVSVLLAAKDLDPLQAFLESPELKEAMMLGGVKGKPTIQIMSLVESETNEELGDLVSAVVKHKVADFDAWKEAFDAREAAREEADLYGHAIATAVDEDTTVYVYLQAREQEALDKFLASKDLKQAMKAAGVQGTPEITKFSEEEDERYK